MKRQHRLSRSRDFDAVYRQGRSTATRYLVLYTFPRADEDAAPPRLGLAVPRQVGPAVARNGVKRRLREAFVGLDPPARSGLDYVLIVRPGLVETLDARGYSWLVEQVRSVFDQAGAQEAVSA
jgi:ribonuclease P protein component